jgi:hypothetical protein
MEVTVPEWRPGVLEGLLKAIGTTGQASLRAGLFKIAAAIEAKAKAELSLTSHQFGTKSPAPSGGPPSLISGTGRRSITHQYVKEGIETIMKVGTAANVYPRYNGRTPSSRYLYYQETDPEFDHPFLEPSFLSIIHEKGVATWMEAFRVWPRLP